MLCGELRPQTPLPQTSDIAQTGQGGAGRTCTWRALSPRPRSRPAAAASAVSSAPWCPPAAPHGERPGSSTAPSEQSLQSSAPAPQRTASAPVPAGRRPCTLPALSTPVCWLLPATAVVARSWRARGEGGGEGVFGKFAEFGSPTPSFFSRPIAVNVSAWVPWGRSAVYCTADASADVGAAA